MYFTGTAPNLNDFLKKKFGKHPALYNVLYFIFNAFLRSYSEIVWINNPWTGLCVFIAIALQDRWQLLATFVTVLVSTATARTLEFNAFTIDTVRRCKLDPRRLESTRFQSLIVKRITVLSTCM